MGKGGCNESCALDQRKRTVQESSKVPPTSHALTEPASSSEQARAAAVFTWDVIAQHSSPDSCWVVVNNKVHDVTDFAPRHPGGRAILAYGGRDASDVFAAFHDNSTWSELDRFCIGVLQVTEPDPMLASFRRMRHRMIREGLFKSSKFFYALKTLSVVAIFATAVGILAAGNDSWSACLMAAFLVGLAWQQSGWLAHDFLHHQVFSNRAWNNVFGYLIGNVFQGFSVDWWKNKHNTHHAVPNECTQDAFAVDPDIDTLPLLAWHEDMAKHASGFLERFILRNQHFFFFPIMLFARVAWAQQSASHVVNICTSSWKGALELMLLGVHYGVFVSLAFANLSVVKACSFLVLAQVLSGFMLALVFVQSHNAMEVYMKQRDFVSAQLVSTRNIAPSLWNDWFTGGLNYQIEHHLFPTLPRHNLAAAKKLVVQFCKEHSFTYESCSMDTSMYRVMHHLATVAAKL